jgi:hypothetical protein
MQITDMLGQMGGVRSMARELGVSESQAESGAAALLPAILGGFKKQAQSQPAGVEGLGGVLAKLGGGSLLDDVLSPAPTNVSRGNEVLGTIFGSKDVSRAVAQNAAAQTGLEPSLLKKMLPMLGMLAAGYMAKQSAGARPQASTGGGGIGGLVGGLAGALGQGARGKTQGESARGGLASMLDLGGDGNPLDDILRMASKNLR